MRRADIELQHSQTVTRRLDFNRCRSPQCTPKRLSRKAEGPRNLAQPRRCRRSRREPAWASQARRPGSLPRRPWLLLATGPGPPDGVSLWTAGADGGIGRPSLERTDHRLNFGAVKHFLLEQSLGNRVQQRRCSGQDNFRAF